MCITSDQYPFNSSPREDILSVLRLFQSHEYTKHNLPATKIITVYTYFVIKQFVSLRFMEECTSLWHLIYERIVRSCDKKRVFCQHHSGGRFVFSLIYDLFQFTDMFEMLSINLFAAVKRFLLTQLQVQKLKPSRIASRSSKIFSYKHRIAS